MLKDIGLNILIVPLQKDYTFTEVIQYFTVSISNKCIDKYVFL